MLLRKIIRIKIFQSVKMKERCEIFSINLIMIHEYGGKRMKRIFYLIIANVLFSAIAFQPAKAEERKIELADNSRSAILMEFDTGTILYEKNVHESLPPASMTKIMSMLLIMEALRDGKIQLNEKVRASEHAASMGGTQIFLEEGEEMTVEELLRGVAIGSANDATVALAEHIAGSEEAFVQRMNERAKELGLKNTNFVNSTGLPAENHYSSAYDMAILGRELLKHEDITKFTSLYESYLRENTDKKFWLVNTNKLVRFYDGADGLKTGYTSDAKYCLTATAKRNGMRVIAVVFGAPTSKERNRQITKMFDYAFSQYETKPIFKKGELVGEAPVKKGKTRTVNAKTLTQVSLLAGKGEKMEGVKTEITYRNNLQAPIKSGDIIGKVTVFKDGKPVSETDLVAEKSVDRAGWWTLFKRSFGEFTKIGR